MATSARPDVIFDLLAELSELGSKIFEPDNAAHVALVERGLAELSPSGLLHRLVSVSTRGQYALNEAHVAAGEALLAWSVVSEVPEI